MTAKYTKKIASKPKRKTATLSAAVRVYKRLSVMDRRAFLKKLGPEVGALPKKADVVARTLKKVKTYLTPQQVANELGVSKPYILKLIKDGKIAASNFGKRNRITPEDFEKFKKEFTKRMSTVEKSVKKSIEDFGDAYFDDLPESMK